MFSYRMCDLLDPASPWWVVANSELAAKTAAFVLFDVYDLGRLCAFSWATLWGTRRLNLKVVF